MITATLYKLVAGNKANHVCNAQFDDQCPIEKVLSDGSKTMEVRGILVVN